MQQNTKIWIAIDTTLAAIVAGGIYAYVGPLNSPFWPSGSAHHSTASQNDAAQVSTSAAPTITPSVASSSAVASPTDIPTTATPSPTRSISISASATPTKTPAPTPTVTHTTPKPGPTSTAPAPDNFTGTLAQWKAHQTNPTFVDNAEHGGLWVSQEGNVFPTGAMASVVGATNDSRSDLGPIYLTQTDNAAVVVTWQNGLVRAYGEHADLTPNHAVPDGATVKNVVLNNDATELTGIEETFTNAAPVFYGAAF